MHHTIRAPPGYNVVHFAADGSDFHRHREKLLSLLIEVRADIQSKTMNKRARFNTTFGETAVTASTDFQQPTVHKFPTHLAVFRAGLEAHLGSKAHGLNAEGNQYYEPKSGIGFHGDAERKIVICLSLGGSSVLRYHWRFPGSSEHTLRGIDLRVGHGDLYP